MTGREAGGDREGGGVAAGRLLRLGLLAALFLGLAWYTLNLVQGRAQQGPAYTVQPVARVVEAPAWLGEKAGEQLARRITEELGNRPFHLRNRETLSGLCRRLREQGVAVDASWIPKLPGQVRLDLRLRRPCARFRWRGEDLLVDGAGALVRLSLAGVADTLPEITWAYGKRPPRYDPFLRAGAGVVREVQRQFLPRLPGGKTLKLVAVDVSNLDYRLLRSHSVAQVRIRLATPGGSEVLCEWGHPPGSRMVRIPLADKVRVARHLLGRYPGLEGLEAIDLRYPNAPETWVRRR